MASTNNLVVVELAQPVGDKDARNLAEMIVRENPDVICATPAKTDGFGHTIYDVANAVRK